MTRPRWLVMKFGGTSVSTAENWRRIASLVEERLASGYRILIVHSALAGVSNHLQTLLDRASDGGEDEQLAEIGRRHNDLAGQLNVDRDTSYGPFLDELASLVNELNARGELSPRRHARILAIGELAATRVGASFLSDSGLPVTWLDARDLLMVKGGDERHERARYLAAHCDSNRDPALEDVLTEHTDIVVTQGFIARDANGDTVLLGRGGSDTSATSLAARIGAERCEIWTDVHGMFSADPRIVPTARLIRSLGYDEAQEVASAGGAVLHPRCITPVRKSSIPLLIRNTTQPQMPGTTITEPAADEPAQLKAIACRPGLTLIGIRSMDMWQQVGFLAQMFECFQKHGVCVDLVATSESNVTVSIDPEGDTLDERILVGLIDELGVLGKVTVIPACTAVSLVGRNVSAVLHRIGPALRAFEGERMHLISQASNGLNLTFVVDTDEANRLVSELHGLLIDQFDDEWTFGPTWDDLQGDPR